MNLLRTSVLVGLVVFGSVLAWSPLTRERHDGGLQPVSSVGTVDDTTGATAAGPAGSGAGDEPPAPRPDGLDPGLVAAFERARAAAADAGHDLVINSGYRTPERQQELLEDEIVKRGSFEEANRWVFTPEKTMHVQGLAIDVGDGPAADWLADRGARFGLCRTLDWEWWHFEWRERWERSGECPAAAQDPSEAPGV